jgi:hypothetical protein
MHDAALMRVVHRSSKRLDQLDGHCRRQRRAVELVGETAAATELQGEEGQAVVLANLVDLHDVRMLQARHRFRLGAETGQVLAAGMAAGQDHL